MEMSVFLSDGGKVARPSTTQGSNSTRGTTRCISVQEVAARTDLVHELYKGKRGLCHCTLQSVTGRPWGPHRLPVPTVQCCTLDTHCSIFYEALVSMHRGLAGVKEAALLKLYKQRCLQSKKQVWSLLFLE
jgi:hypothetical protein